MKFRVWSNLNKRYVQDEDDYFIQSDGELFEISWSGASNRLNPEEYIVEFYTGFYDKNNREIYTGDILVNVLNDFVDDMPFVVKWDDRFLTWFWYNSNDNQDCFNQSIAEDCEIISNIHEGGIYDKGESTGTS